MINTALVIEDPRGIEVFRILQKSGEINLIGLVDLTREPSWLTPEERKRCLVTADLNAVVALPELQVVLNITADPEINGSCKKTLIRDRSSPDPAGWFVMSLLHLKDSHYLNQVLKGELWAVLNSVQDAIELLMPGDYKVCESCLPRGLLEYRRESGLTLIFLKFHPMVLWPSL